MHYVERILGETFAPGSAASGDQGARPFICTKAGFMRIGTSSTSWRPAQHDGANLERVIRMQYKSLGRPIDLWMFHGCR